MNSEKDYVIRKNCIICDTLLTNKLFKYDYEIPVACYSKENKSDDIIIPYNILRCIKCKTSQIKYLGDLNEVYKENHADNTGSIMKNLHLKILNKIKNYKLELNIENIIEVGCSKGILSDLVLDNNIVNKYYIIEPKFIGVHRENKIVINNFFENVSFSEYNNCNTLVISHVFEHFYNPIEILEVIQSNYNINNFILVWPDLEYYKDNNVYHVLNTEHTYYIDNEFIIKLLNNFSFELIEKSYHANHSVIYIFKRNNSLKKLELVNINYDLTNYYENLINKKENITNFIDKMSNKKICIWPSSVHTQFLLVFINDLKLDYVLDNSPNKIGKFLYGSNIECLDFEKYCINEKYAIILNGGIFNDEVKYKITNQNNLLILN